MNRKQIRYFSVSAGLLAAAFSGLMNGCQKVEPPADNGTQTATTEPGKHACKGLNSCKGQGGCSTGDAGCKGKNSCKGKGGCNTLDATSQP